VPSSKPIPMRAPILTERRFISVHAFPSSHHRPPRQHLDAMLMPTLPAVPGDDAGDDRQRNDVDRRDDEENGLGAAQLTGTLLFHRWLPSNADLMVPVPLVVKASCA